MKEIRIVPQICRHCCIPACIENSLRIQLNNEWDQRRIIQELGIGIEGDINGQFDITERIQLSFNLVRRLINETELGLNFTMNITGRSIFPSDEEYIGFIDNHLQLVIPVLISIIKSVLIEILEKKKDNTYRFRIKATGEIREDQLNKEFLEFPISTNLNIPHINLITQKKGELYQCYDPGDNTLASLSVADLIQNINPDSGIAVIYKKSLKNLIKK